MEIKTKYDIDAEVWVIENLGERMRPVKKRVFGIQVVVTPQGKKEEYFSSDGAPINEVFPSMEVAEEGIKIIEHHKNAFAKAMESLLGEERPTPPPKTDLVDATGKKIV